MVTTGSGWSRKGSLEAVRLVPPRPRHASAFVPLQSREGAARIGTPSMQVSFSLLLVLVLVLLLVLGLFVSVLLVSCLVLFLFCRVIFSFLLHVVDVDCLFISVLMNNTKSRPRVCRITSLGIIIRTMYREKQSTCFGRSNYLDLGFSASGCTGCDLVERPA